MNPIVQEIIGAGFGGAVTLAIVGFIHYRGRIGRVPKRVDRLEAVIPAMIRAEIATLEFHIYGELNGTTKDLMKKSLDELRLLTSDGVVSRKEGR